MSNRDINGRQALCRPVPASLVAALAVLAMVLIGQWLQSAVPMIFWVYVFVSAMLTMRMLSHLGIIDRPFDSIACCLSDPRLRKIWANYDGRSLIGFYRVFMRRDAVAIRHQDQDVRR